MASTKSIFTYQKQPRPITSYMLSRGVADFSDLYQWDNYETGYGFFFVLEIPRFLEEMKKLSTDYKTLIENYVHILEYDFKNLSGFEDMTADSSTLTDGINELNIVTRVREQSNGSFTMRMYERSGSVINKVNELFLRGVKDPRTQVKRYNGLLDPSYARAQNVNSSGTATGSTTTALNAGYENETFTFLYFATDNTCLNIEKAFLLTSCQPQNAELSMYEYEKGNIEWREINYTFSGFPITGPGVTKKAQDFLKWVNESTIFDESKFGYAALQRMPASSTYNAPVVQEVKNDVFSMNQSRVNSWWKDDGTDSNLQNQ
ncbi:MAG: hypothetical protein IJ193_00650 [Bacilli bacterium]|nr:hypothetical protein [Bacilli bacterium]